jgi:hypothetical protein
MDAQRIVKGSLEPLPFYLVLASDHRSPATGITPSLVRISKAAGAFAAPQGAISERGNGAYQVAGNTTDSNTTGPLILHAEGPGCDPVDIRFEVVPDEGTPPLSQGSTTYPMTFLMIDSADHVTGKINLSPTFTIAKPGGSFAAPAGAVAEIGGAGNGFGWYSAGPASADYDTAGPLLGHATAAGADPTDDKYDVAAVLGFGGTPVDLITALIALCDGHPTLPGLFGQAGSTQKFFSDGAPTSTALPYLTWDEGSETAEYHSNGDDGLYRYIDNGQLTLSVYASSRAQVKTLGKAVEKAVNDAALSFGDGTLLHLRRGSHSIGLDPDKGPDGKDCWAYTATFDVFVSSTL